MKNTKEQSGSDKPFLQSVEGKSFTASEISVPELIFASICHHAVRASVHPSVI